jgi:hypothetical protein
MGPFFAMDTPLATHVYSPGGALAAIEFLKRTRWELRSLRFVRIWKDRLRVYDINQDCFEIHGIGYGDADIIPLLRLVNTAYNPETIHLPTEEEFKELKTGRRHPWAEDRVM